MGFCSSDELTTFESRGAPGDVLVYFRGWPFPGDPKIATREERTKINRIRMLYNAGQVDLVQKRRAPFNFEYRAIFRDRPAQVKEKLLLPILI